jgi:RNA 2',3'-cyclic 3'-phosphodiesterase
VRVFVAVFPPPEVREALAGAARRLPVKGNVRLTAPANVHLTLEFLGDVPEDDVGHVARALEPVREGHAPFEAAISGFGAFPSPGRARILWAGIGEGSENLRALARDVEERLAPLGFEREARPYHPHLTLGRARGRPVALQDTEVSPPVAGFLVRQVELVESVLGEAGATYSTLEAYPLSEGRDQGSDGDQDEEQYQDHND